MGFDEDFERLFGSDDGNTHQIEEAVQTAMGGDDDLAAGLDCYVDLCLCIDVTGSMSPIISTVKGMALSLYDDMVKALKKQRRVAKQFRVKVIPFRDYYCDGKYAMDESRFFTISEGPSEEEAFRDYVMNLTADGGGDEPENALEALALAMKSDWYQPLGGEKARHIMILFTDASAHPLEKAKEGVTDYYPKDMLESISELNLAWEGRTDISGSNRVAKYEMNQTAKRLIVYAPIGSYPWGDITTLSNAKVLSIAPAKGGKELDKQVLLDDIAGSIK